MRIYLGLFIIGYCRGHHQLFRGLFHLLPWQQPTWSTYHCHVRGVFLNCHWMLTAICKKFTKNITVIMILYINLYSFFLKICLLSVVYQHSVYIDVYVQFTTLMCWCVSELSNGIVLFNDNGWPVTESRVSFSHFSLMGTKKRMISFYFAA